MADVTLDEFREGLLEARAVLTRLAPLCKDFQELTDLIDLAVGDQTHPGNSAQLKLLMDVVIPPQPQTQQSQPFRRA